MYDFSKACDVEKYFNDILKQINNKKVKAVFSLYRGFWGRYNNRRTYYDDESLYVLFDDNTCFVIDYYFIDELEIQYKEISKKEMELYEQQIVKDYFNCSIDIYNHHTDQISEKTKICLEYDAIKEIKINRISREYQKWIDGDIDFVKPTKETFDKIKFVMNNGKSFVVCAEEADADGYCLTWSDDAVETIQGFEN